MEYEADIRAEGISEPHHLLRLTPAVIETLIPDKPIHQRKLAALSRGRNLNTQTISMKLESKGAAPGSNAPSRSHSADDVIPEDSMHDMRRLFHGEAIQSFLMTQGVLNEDGLMVRGDLKMLATAEMVVPPAPRHRPPGVAWTSR